MHAALSAWSRTRDQRRRAAAAGTARLLVRVHKDSLRRLPPSAVACSQALASGASAPPFPPCVPCQGSAAAHSAVSRALAPALRQTCGAAGAMLAPDARAWQSEEAPCAPCRGPVGPGALRACFVQITRPHCSPLLCRCASYHQQPLLTASAPGCLARCGNQACPGAGRPLRSLTCARPSAATLEAGSLPAAARGALISSKRVSLRRHSLLTSTSEATVPMWQCVRHHRDRICRTWFRARPGFRRCGGAIRGARRAAPRSASAWQPCTYSLH